LQQHNQNKGNGNQDMNGQDKRFHADISQKIRLRALLLSVYFGFFNQNGCAKHQNHKTTRG
jgi:hypothetical protein